MYLAPFLKSQSNCACLSFGTVNHPLAEPSVTFSYIHSFGFQVDGSVVRPKAEQHAWQAKEPIGKPQ